MFEVDGDGVVCGTLACYYISLCMFLAGLLFIILLLFIYYIIYFIFLLKNPGIQFRGENLYSWRAASEISYDF